MNRSHFMILAKFSKLLLLLFLLGLATNNYAQSVSLFLNKSSFTSGERLELAVAADSNQIAVTEADVYLAVQFPEGSLYYLSDLENIFFADRNKIVPVVSAWPVKTIAKITLFSLEIPKKLSSGTYKWYLTLVPVGMSVEQPANWIANTSIELVLTGGTGSFNFAEEDSSLTRPTGSLDTSSEMTTGGSEVAPSAPPSGASTGKAESAGMEVAPPLMDDEWVDCCIDGDFWISPTKPPIQSGTLTAGDIDDNLNLIAFQRYAEKQLKNNTSLPFFKVEDRVTLKIVDSQGQGVSNARIAITATGTSTPLLDTYVGTDGRFYLFPHFDAIKATQLDLKVSPPEDVFGSPATVALKTMLNLQQLDGSRELTLTLPNVTAALPPSLDLMFVIDTTGSMSDELDYLTVELRDIISVVHARYPQVDMRFGLIVYRDKGDVYVVRDLGFTDSINSMQIQLSEQRAIGGGDYPEAMEQAMASAVNAQWRVGNVARLLFLIADAPPHNENLLTMLAQVHTARQMGLRIYSLAASGVGDVAEFILRASSVFTQGRYLFLTDDSGVGLSHAEPTVPCYVVTHLDKLVSRVIISELSGKRVEPESAEVIRTVGGYEAGLCELSSNQQ